MFSEEDALFWDVLSKCERELIIRIPKYDNEQLLMEQMKLLAVRAHRLLARIREAGATRIDVERYEAELTRVQGRMLQCIIARIKLQMDLKRLSLVGEDAIGGKDPLIAALVDSLNVWDDAPEDD
jgi:hypothetical protein